MLDFASKTKFGRFSRRIWQPSQRGEHLIARHELAYISTDDFTILNSKHRKMKSAECGDFFTYQQIDRFNIYGNAR